MGNVSDLEFPGREALNKENAVLAMLRIANEHPGKVTLVATGPLTNLALALNMDPTFPQKIKSLFIMGGNMEYILQGVARPGYSEGRLYEENFSSF